MRGCMEKEEGQHGGRSEVLRMTTTRFSFLFCFVSAVNNRRKDKEKWFFLFDGLLFLIF